MALVEQLREGTRLFDTILGRERMVHHCSPMGNTLKFWFKDQKTGAIEQPIYILTDAEKRFQVIESGSSVFRADPELVRMVAEGYRLQHAYLGYGNDSYKKQPFYRVVSFPFVKQTTGTLLAAAPHRKPGLGESSG